MTDITKPKNVRELITLMRQMTTTMREIARLENRREKRKENIDEWYKEKLDPLTDRYKALRSVLFGYIIRERATLFHDGSTLNLVYAIIKRTTGRPLRGITKKNEPALVEALKEMERPDVISLTEHVNKEALKRDPELMKRLGVRIGLSATFGFTLPPTPLTGTKKNPLGDSVTVDED